MAAPIPLDPPVTTATRIGATVDSPRRERPLRRKDGPRARRRQPPVDRLGIAQQLADGGAQLAFTYQGERIEKNVRELAETVGSPLITSCDVRSDEDLERVFAEVGETFGGKLDLLVHSVAFADARDLEGRFTDTPRDRFWLALDVSAYSLVACGGSPSR